MEGLVCGEARSRRSTGGIFALGGESYSSDTRSASQPVCTVAPHVLIDGLQQLTAAAMSHVGNMADGEYAEVSLERAALSS